MIELSTPMAEPWALQPAISQTRADVEAVTIATVIPKSTDNTAKKTGSTEKGISRMTTDPARRPTMMLGFCPFCPKIDP